MANVRTRFNWVRYTVAWLQIGWGDGRNGWRLDAPFQYQVARKLASFVYA